MAGARRGNYKKGRRLALVVCLDLGSESSRAVTTAATALRDIGNSQKGADRSTFEVVRKARRAFRDERGTLRVPRTCERADGP